MKENQKVYVRAVYLDNKLHSVNIRCDVVLLTFIEDVKEYTEDESYRLYYLNDKIIVELKNSSVKNELFICNYNEISNYLH